jgi:hypothetical protein
LSNLYSANKGLGLIDEQLLARNLARTSLWFRPPIGLFLALTQRALSLRQQRIALSAVALNKYEVGKTKHST